MTSEDTVEASLATLAALMATSKQFVEQRARCFFFARNQTLITENIFERELTKCQKEISFVWGQ